MVPGGGPAVGVIRERMRRVESAWAVVCPLRCLAVTVVVAALVTALGAVIVALVAAVGSRLDSRDARSRLLKDIEISSKLPDGSNARTVLERHIAQVVGNLTEREQKQEIRRNYRGWLAISGLLVVAALTMKIVGHPLPTTNDYRKQLEYWSGLVIVYAVLAYVVSLVAWVRAIMAERALRKRRKSATETTDEASTAGQ